MKTIENTLITANKNNIKVLAFPIMGAGFYLIQPDVAISIMFKTIKKFLANNSSLKEIIICGNDNRELRLLASKFSLLK